MHRFALAFAVVLFLGSSLFGQELPEGPVGQVAPKWEIERWIGLPEGQKTLELDQLQGKVIYIYAFQSWCPGCHQVGFPALQKIAKRYEKDERVAVLAMQTVFEGFEVNTFGRMQAMKKRYKLDIPFGHDPGKNGKRSHILDRYDTYGTPWHLVIDGRGVVRFNAYRNDELEAVKTIDGLLAKRGPDGLLVGRTFPGLAEESFIRGGHHGAFDATRTLVTFWRPGHAEDEAALRALGERLGQHERQGLEMLVLAADQGKPRLSDKELATRASRLGFERLLSRDTGNRVRDQLRRLGALPKLASPVLLVDELGSILWADGRSAGGKEKAKVLERLDAALAPAKSDDD